MNLVNSEECFSNEIRFSAILKTSLKQVLFLQVNFSNGPFPASFLFIFVFSIQITVDSK